MNNRRNLAPSPTPLSSDERIDDYLEHLCAPLVGIVPYPERKNFRRETKAHIDGLVDEYLWQGKDPDAATDAALREFGEPWKVGQAFLQEWLQGTAQSRPAPLVRKATCTAFVWFGIGSLLVLLPLEQDVFAGPQEDRLAIARLLAIALPIIAGILTGATTPKQAERGVRNAVCVLAFHTLALGCLLLPRQEGIMLAAWQIVFWLPVGYATTALTARGARMLRRQQFWHVSRT